MRIRSARLTAVPSGRRDETGFTLVEVMVGLTILAVGLVGVIGVTNGNLKTAAGANARSKAISIATLAIESVRAIPYDQLPSTAGGPVAMHPAPPEVESNPIAVGGRTFRTQRVLSNDPANVGYKQVIVTVDWRDEHGSHVLSQTSSIYPGGIGPAANAPTNSGNGGSNCTPPVPTSLTATVPLGSAGYTAIDLRWSMPQSSCQAANFVIQYSTNAFTTATQVTSSAFADEYRVEGLASGTALWFRVASKSDQGQQSGWSSVVTASTTAVTVTPCGVGNVTVTPAAINKKNRQLNAGLDTPYPVVNVPSSGNCTGFRIEYKPLFSGAIVSATMVGSGSQWSRQIDGNRPWDIGKHYVDVYDTSVTPNKRVASVLLTVCEHNSACG